MENRRFTNRQEEEEDKVLRTAITIVIFLLVLAFAFVGYRLLNPRMDVSAGREKLEELESVDVETVEAALSSSTEDADQDTDAGDVEETETVDQSED